MILGQVDDERTGVRTDVQANTSRSRTCPRKKQGNSKENQKEPKVEGRKFVEESGNLKEGAVKSEDEVGKSEDGSKMI